MMGEISRIVGAFREVRILVLGDFMLDEYLWGNIQRISPEAPVPVLRLVKREYTLGGAGNVAKNLLSLGAGVTVAGVVGNDRTGKIIGSELAQLGAEAHLFRESGRNSTRKTRLMSVEHGQQVFRFDQESTRAIGVSGEEAVVNLLQAKACEVQAIVCSDYLKGCLTPRVLQTAAALGKEHCLPVVMAPKGSDASKYRDSEALILNLRELELLSGTKADGTDSLHGAVLRLMEQAYPHWLLVTRGSNGMSLFQGSTNAIQQIDIPAMARSVYDVTGAGDTVVAMFTAAIAVGADHEAAARMANLAAGVVVGKRGTATLTPEELLDNVPRVAIAEAV